MARPVYVYLWEYRVRRDRLAEFERVYGAEGDWVKLFHGAPGYLRTELHRDTAEPRRFITIDYWESRQAWDAFRAKNAEAFEALDAKCERLTEREAEVGRFEAAG